MNRRLVLDKQLRQICTNIYYQPPSNIKLVYPCIIYSLEKDHVDYANNENYNLKNQFQILLITKNPEDSIHDLIRKLKFCRFDRRYVVDSLYHDSFTIFI